MPEQHRELVRLIFEELFNKDRYELADEIYCDEMQNFDVSLPGPPNSKSEIVNLLQFHRRAFPDLVYTLKQVVCEGDMIACRWAVAGTHTGPLGDLPPTGNPFHVEGMSFLQIEGGKVKAIWQLHDTEATHLQLGMDPVAVSANEHLRKAEAPGTAGTHNGSLA